MLITHDGPYDLDASLHGGQAFRWRRVDDGWNEGVLFDNLVLLRQRADGIEMVCGPEPVEEVAPLVRDYLALGPEMKRAHMALRGDDALDRAFEGCRGVRILRQDPWECLIGFIISSNSNIPRIAGNVESLAETFGGAVEYDGRRRATFPTPDQLASAGEPALRDLRLGYRARFVAGTAEIVASGGLDLHALREAPYDDALEALIALPGVADKVANCVLLLSLDKPTAFPVDVWVRRAIEEWYLPPGEKMTDKKMRLWAQNKFGEHAGYANQYLFHYRRLIDGETS